MRNARQKVTLSQYKYWFDVGTYTVILLAMNYSSQAIPDTSALGSYDPMIFFFKLSQASFEIILNNIFKRK